MHYGKALTEVKCKSRGKFQIIDQNCLQNISPLLCRLPCRLVDKPSSKSRGDAHDVPASSHNDSLVQQLTELENSIKALKKQVFCWLSYGFNNQLSICLIMIRSRIN
jgi:hypothetical protein